MKLLFVTPPLDGPISGGTLYNRQLVAALRRQSVTVQWCGLADAARAPADSIWIDSLYMAELPAMRRNAQPRTRIGLLLHYLPTLLRTAAPRVHELSEVERAALAAADLIVVPSPTMQALVRALAPDRQVLCIAPGIASEALASNTRRDLATCVMVCNVTENKGVLSFLEALGSRIAVGDALRLIVAGRLDAEPDYARACRLSVANNALSGHVKFVGELAQPDVFAWLAKSALCISASRMESFGMALAEARAHGTPILARAGGHVAAHVAASAGGQLVADEHELSQALLALLRQPTELVRRIALAEADRPLRSWSAVAREFSAACASAHS